ncbi:MAG: hypothetical protein PHR53_03775 [Bacteroidales bacterium]|nr:hypothetical protein [Bacteroidales bacterium]
MSTLINREKELMSIRSTFCKHPTLDEISWGMCNIFHEFFWTKKNMIISTLLPLLPILEFFPKCVSVIPNFGTQTIPPAKENPSILKLWH